MPYHIIHNRRELERVGFGSEQPKPEPGPNDQCHVQNPADLWPVQVMLDIRKCGPYLIT